MRLKRRPPVAPRQRRSSEVPPPPAAFSYHVRRDERPEDLSRKQFRQAPLLRASSTKLSKSSSRLLLLIAVFLVVYLLNLSTTVSVKVLASNQPNLTTASAQTYAQAARDILSRSIWNHNKLTVNTAGLSQQLQKQFPSLESVTVTVPFVGNRLQVNIAPTQAALILVTSSGSYIIDENGKAASALSSTEANKLHLPTLTDQSSLAIKLTKQILTPAQIQFIQIVLHQLTAKQVPYGALVLPSSAGELDVYISGQPYFVKFNLQSDTAREQAGTFLAVRQNLAGQHLTPTKYIDVRIEGRAYYQ